MTFAVDRVAGGAAEGVVVARKIEVVLPLVGAMAVEIVGVDVRDDAGGRGIDEVTDAVVRHCDGRGHAIVIIFGAREITGVIIGVVGDDAARPSAASEFAVGSVVIARALAVGVEFVRHTARRFVVEPAGGVAVRKRLIAIGGHRDLVAVGVVGVVDRVSRSTLGDDTLFGVVGRGDGMAERIGDGDLSTERVVRISRLVAERVDGLGNAALRIVDDLRRVAADISLRDLATERVVGVGRGYAGMGAGGDGQSVASDRFGGKRRVWG